MQLDDGRRRGRRAANKVDPIRGPADEGDVLVFCRNRTGFERGEVDGAHPVNPVPHIAAHQLARRSEREGGKPEHPLRSAEFSGERVDRLDPGGIVQSVAADTEQVPPSPLERRLGAIGDEIKRAVGRPFGLEDRLVGSSGDEALVADRAVGGTFADP